MDMESISTAMSTAFGNVQTNVTSMITTCAPYALGIIGTVLAVTIGIKVFRNLLLRPSNRVYHSESGQKCPLFYFFRKGG